MTETPQQTTDTSAYTIAHAIAELLDEKKATDIVILDMRERASFCAFQVIATGQVSRHVATLGEHVVKYLKQAGLPHRVEGMTQGDWVLVDGGDVVIHLFRPEVRENYALEKIWTA